MLSAFFLSFQQRCFARNSECPPKHLSAEHFQNFCRNGGLSNTSLDASLAGEDLLKIFLPFSTTLLCAKLRMSPKHLRAESVQNFWRRGGLSTTPLEGTMAGEVLLRVLRGETGQCSTFFLNEVFKEDLRADIASLLWEKLRMSPQTPQRRILAERRSLQHLPGRNCGRRSSVPCASGENRSMHHILSKRGLRRNIVAEWATKDNFNILRGGSLLKTFLRWGCEG